MNRRGFARLLAGLASVVVGSGQAQTQKPRVGVIHEGGPYNAMLDGFKSGLRELGLEPGRDLLLEISDVHGERTAAARAAHELEQAKVNLLFSMGSSVSIAAKNATAAIPIVFATGGDAVKLGFATSPARPEGRMSGVQYLALDLTAKRLDILRQIVTGLKKVVTLYDPTNPARGIELTRDAARRLRVALVELPVTSVAQLQDRFRTLRPEDADAFFYTSDAMVVSQGRFVIDTAREKKLPTMFGELSLVEQGALASYGVDFFSVGRLCAKYVQRVLAGIRPAELPIESISRYGLEVNLRTARELGITIPQSILLQADKVVE